MAKHIPNVQHKRGTAAAMREHNIVLAEGEFGVETDTLKIKVGDGAATWRNLPYVNFRVDKLADLNNNNPNLAPKEAALGYVPDADYTTDAATGQFVLKVNQSLTQPASWAASEIGRAHV